MVWHLNTQIGKFSCIVMELVRFYPNTDWWDETMKSYAPQNRYNVNLSGGTDKVKYFVNMGMLTQRSLFKTESGKKLRL